VFQDNNSISREEYWESYSEDSEYSRERRGDPKHNRGATAYGKEERYLRSPTPQLEGEEDDLIQKNARGSISSGTSVFTSYKTRTWRPAGRYAPSHDTKPRNSRR
jgi:hypothetical protein